MYSNIVDLKNYTRRDDTLSLGTCVIQHIGTLLYKNGILMIDLKSNEFAKFAKSPHIARHNLIIFQYEDAYIQEFQYTYTCSMSEAAECKLDVKHLQDFVIYSIQKRRHTKCGRMYKYIQYFDIKEYRCFQLITDSSIIY